MAGGERVATARRAPSVLESKLTPPAAREGLLVRRRLLSPLDSHASRKLTLLTAPCGYGKTSLLATWAARPSSEAVAWLTLDARDSDCVRFWSYVAEAVERVRPGVGRRAATLIGTRGARPELGLDELLADLALAAPLAIVLDDVHVVDNPECFSLLAYAVERLPAGVRLIVGTRSDLPLPLARLRASDLLGEVRASELAFTTDEARALLVGSEGLDLGGEEVDLIVEWTEGWPVALYLAALWLRDQEDQRSKARELVGEQRWVGEYLTDEILNTLDPETRDFLVQSSVLSRLTGTLCDDVLERAGSDGVLRGLSRANLLVAPDDPHGDWFRVHRLFRELLQLELERGHPGLARTLRRRATGWFERHGLVEDAVDHALAVGDYSRAAEILADAWLRLFRDGEGATLLRLVERLPTDVLIGHPELTAGSALATYVARRPAHERSRWLAITDRSRTESPQTWTLRAARSASLARATAVDDGIDAAMKDARRALEISQELEDGEGEVPALAALAYLEYVAGEREEARLDAAAAVASPEAPDRPHGVARALGLLALLAADAGRMDEADAKAHAAIEFGRDRSLSTATSMHVAHLARARALAAKGGLGDAEAAAELAERLSRMPEPSIPHAFALLVLADVRMRRGRLETAAETLAEAAREIETFTDAGRLPRMLASARRRLRAARRDHSVATEPLSAAESAVLSLLETELSQSAIGRRQFLSVNTIKTHTRSIYRKLGVSSRAEAIARARAIGLLADEADSPR